MYSKPLFMSWNCPKLMAEAKLCILFSGSEQIRKLSQDSGLIETQKLMMFAVSLARANPSLCKKQTFCMPSKTIIRTQLFRLKHESSPLHFKFSLVYISFRVN